MKTQKTWREKMNNPKLPKLVHVLPNMRGKLPNGTMLVPSPLEVEAFVRTIRRGSVATLSEMREFLADQHDADATCPLTTGIFLHIAAEAGEEDARHGVPNATPYWRVVKDDGSLNPRLPGGVARQAEYLRREGHQIVPGRGNRPPRVVLGEMGKAANESMERKLPAAESQTNFAKVG